MSNLNKGMNKHLLEGAFPITVQVKFFSFKICFKNTIYIKL
jgi:hypothetical protein